MLSGITVQVPAKVNLGLNVLPKRADGYHNIESIFQTINLCDTITVLLDEKQNSCCIACEELDLPLNNTISSTYKAFCQLTGCTAGVMVNLTKRIPSGGGLGGGSADAAYFLKALAYLTGVKLTDSLADGVASQVGSDVFFFLHSGESEGKTGSAIVTGRGEFVKPIRPRNDLFFVLVFPGVHSSTKEAYELVDKAYSNNQKVICPKISELEAVYNRPVKEWTFANTFTSVLVQKYTVIGDALEDIRKSGALWSDMSGSGATVFGVYESEQSAKKACEQLHKSWSHCVLVT